jgi:hydrogenase large subunit
MGQDMSDTTRLIAGPFNRVEGDLELTLDITDGRVREARANSPLFRGFEMILVGKTPLDALTLTPRICGICSISQSMAAARAIAQAIGVTPPAPGQLVAALIHAVENLADHLTHFHLFFMPDFARPAYAGRPWHDRVVTRFTATEGSAIRSATKARADLLHIMGQLAGKWPHTLSLQPGGVTKAPDARDKVRILATLKACRRFLETQLFAAPLEEIAALDGEEALAHWRCTSPRGDMGLFLDIAEDLELDHMGPGPARFLSLGAYETQDGFLFARGLFKDGVTGPVPLEHIAEHLDHSWMTGAAAHPFTGVTQPDPDMTDPAYSWCKAPRLAGETVEVGALARQVVDGHPLARALLRNGAANVRARVLGRLLEVARTALTLEAWAAALSPGASHMAPAHPLETGRGAGLVEAARGSLGHWLIARDGKITNYQIIAPTTWNFSPRDGQGIPGPVEQALEGAQVIPGETTPLSVQHIVRSFDPCMVCTVH